MRAAIRRAFVVDDSGDGSNNGAIAVSISGLTITGGKSLGTDGTVNAGRGGAILNYENLTLSGDVVSNSETNYDGGGIWSRYGDLTLAESTVSGNTAKFYGGGIYFRSGSLQLSSSTISGNELTAGNSGVTGGGVFSTGGAVGISYSTIANNISRRGGGLGSDSGAITLDHSIVADNTASNSGPDIYGNATANWSLIEDATGATISGANNLTGVDPMLGPLADNGGPTPTQAPAAGSPAIDAGDPAAVAGVGGVPLTDQRGFPRIVGDGLDIGAVEAIPTTLVVDHATDESDGDYTTGDLSLREAIELANLAPDANTITFDASLSGGTITLTDGEIAITADATITGPGASEVTISGNHASRIFNVDDGDSGNQAAVAISGLTLANGSASYDGGAIYTRENLTLLDSILSGNSARYNGGGLYNDGGRVTVQNSTLSGNSADNGGGLYNNSGSMTVQNSTLSGNLVTFNGGGLFNNIGASMTVQNSTISGNSASDGGGLYNNLNATMTVQNSTVSGNSATFNGGGLFNNSGAP